MVSIVNILSGAMPLMVDVRQTGGGPRFTLDPVRVPDLRRPYEAMGLPPGSTDAAGGEATALYSRSAADRIHY
jgi:hypothetical protein